MQKDVEKFLVCREVNDFDQSFDFEEFKQQQHGLETIKENLEKLAKWETDISKHIKPHNSQGLIIVVGRKLKDRLMKKVKDEQSNMKSYLYDLADQKAREIEAGFKNIKSTLAKSNSALTAFVEYVNNHKLCEN